MAALEAYEDSPGHPAGLPGRPPLVYPHVPGPRRSLPRHLHRLSQHHPLRGAGTSGTEQPLLLHPHPLRRHDALDGGPVPDNPAVVPQAGPLPRHTPVLLRLGGLYLRLLLPLQDPAGHVYRPDVPADGISVGLVLVPLLYRAEIFAALAGILLYSGPAAARQQCHPAPRKRRLFPTGHRLGFGPAGSGIIPPGLVSVAPPLPVGFRGRHRDDVLFLLGGFRLHHPPVQRPRHILRDSPDPAGCL